MDAEEEESETVEDFFATKLRRLDYDPDRNDVFVSNVIAARWYNAATGGKAKVTGASRALRQLHNEGRAHRIIEARAGGTGARGFRWVGEFAGETDPTRYDLDCRLAKKADEHRQTASGSEGGEAW